MLQPGRYVTMALQRSVRIYPIDTQSRPDRYELRSGEVITVCLRSGMVEIDFNDSVLTVQMYRCGYNDVMNNWQSCYIRVDKLTPMIESATVKQFFIV